MKADLALINAKIWTADDAIPFASAIALKGNKILSVGDLKSVKKSLGDKTEIIDAKNKLILPGFIDSHIHLLIGGARLSQIQLRDTRTRDEFIERISKYAQKLNKGEWILGGDWDHENWGGELPDRKWIDPVTENNPLWLCRLDGHTALSNTAALKAVNFTEDAVDPAGGMILRDISGRLTGIFKDKAMNLLEEKLPLPSQTQNLKSLELASDYLLSNGVTSVHHMGSWEDTEIFETAHRSGLLKTRIYASVPLNSFEKLKRTILERGEGDTWLKLGGLKEFVDGSLGSHTAAFYDDYNDLPGDKGLFVNSLQDIKNMVLESDKSGLQNIIHAIGDKAVNELLNIFEEIESINSSYDRRFRIEHAQHIIPGDISRFKQLRLIASMQPYHLIDDGRWAEKLLGNERIKTTHAYRSLLDNGTKICFGSDWWVAPPNVLLGIYAAVTRRTLDGLNYNGWIPDQKISVTEALQAYTINGAYASFDEKTKGSLTPGKLADLIMLDNNILESDPEMIRKTKVILTILDGRIVFSERDVRG